MIKSLAYCLEHQQQISKMCFDCNEETTIIRKPTSFLKITVKDLPLHHCTACGETYELLSIGLAIEALQQKHSLVGSFSMAELLALNPD